MYKITEEKHRQELDYLHDTFKKKNRDYGNSFETSLNSFGYGILKKPKQVEESV